MNTTGECYNHGPCSSLDQIQIELNEATIVLPAKSDSDVVFCLQYITDLSLIDHLCINLNAQVIYRFTLAKVGCKTKRFT